METKCIICNKEFEKPRRGKIYCSASCKQTAYIKKKLNPDYKPINFNTEKKIINRIDLEKIIDKCAINQPNFNVSILFKKLGYTHNNIINAKMFTDFFIDKTEEGKKIRSEIPVPLKQFFLKCWNWKTKHKKERLYLSNLKGFDIDIKIIKYNKIKKQPDNFILNEDTAINFLKQKGYIIKRKF